MPRSSAGVPLILTEADSHLGLANRLLAGRARRVCLAFPIPGREGERYPVTGRPVPAAVLRADRGAARRRFAVPADARCLLVMGGSQGARSINLAAIEAFAERGRRDFDVIHLAGRRDFDELDRRLRAAPHGERYSLLAYEPDLGEVLAASDLVLARAGRLDLRGRRPRPAGDPRPLPARHRRAPKRQRRLDAGGGGGADDRAIEELSAERIEAEVGSLLSDPGRLAAMASASASLARPDAARRIADEVLAATG